MTAVPARVVATGRPRPNGGRPATWAAVQAPVVLIHAADDPFLPGHLAPHGAIRDNPRLVARFTDRGGHVGFVAGSRPWAARFWAEWEAARFVAARLEPQCAGTGLEEGSESR